jgi:hypothetical protein
VQLLVHDSAHAAVGAAPEHDMGGVQGTVEAE